MAPLHPDVEPLAFLLGTWRGEGTGQYPTVDPFTYTEELVIEHVGDAFLLYRNASWSPDGDPLHFERGFLRPGAAAGEVDLCLAHPLGLVEVSQGRVAGGTLRSRTIDGGAIVRTRTGSAVTALERRYIVDGGTLAYEVAMEMEGIPLAPHTSSRLRRQG
ncbi:MAG TPA: FABP family protein [Actinomycetota bacterium]|nr:FABP family protein [Actinomycetota bacterium]